MAEVVERVAKLEERLDGLSKDMGELRQSMGDLRHEVALRFDGVDRRFLALEARMDAGFEASRQALHVVDDGLRDEVRTGVRWILGGISGATLALLLALIANGLLG